MALDRGDTAACRSVCLQNRRHNFIKPRQKAPVKMFRKRSKNDSQTEYSCSIRFLDDSEPMQLTFKKDTLGQWLFDRVCEKLNLVEKDYFGLRYVDAENQRHWLDPLKTAYKQLKGVSRMVLCFRVKFYPEDPMKLHEEITRYYLFLQLRRDLHHGRLLCPPDDAILLAAYIVQSEVGDYDPQDHPLGYISEFKMLPKQTPKHEEKIMDMHKSLQGQVPADSEANFLQKAAGMDTYGVDPHQVKDQRGDQLYLGVTHLGIMTFRGSRRTQLFKWAQIRRIAYEGKMFIVHHSINEEEDVSNSKKRKKIQKQQATGFRCLTAAAAKYLWRCAVEQQLFFTLSSSSSAPKVRSGGTLFSRGSKFRFSGRCQNEAYEASEHISRKEPNFQRSSSLPNFARRTPDKNSTPRDSVLQDSTKEVYWASGKKKTEAAVDVPNIVVNTQPLSAGGGGDGMLERGQAKMAPLAGIETFEETVAQDTAQAVRCEAAQVTRVVPETMVATSTVPTSARPKENGQVVLEKPGVLETSLDDETLPYEPNQTLDDSDLDNEEDKPSLDDQIMKLEEELTRSQVNHVEGSGPKVGEGDLTSGKAAASKTAAKSGGGCCRALTLSLLVMLVLTAVLFYIVFFSSIQHPLLPKVRSQLHFLEPVRDFVADKAEWMATQAKLVASQAKSLVKGKK